ncbi:LysR family transcriptional regulator [Roseinatronobacter monicus]|uniref:LysR family transcriptional regulator n=1 Tax=Roseinatronobacter monicus TaxID=393481 RepID=A0A543K5Y8_9RHOB|nr:LysR family transcriptional regulator [Roseinatronobacter monicus]TQM90496.1 LysR family transcriptional regulator [Roseinatronobacter monicus]
MDIRWLEDFLTLVEMRNFTRAAEFRNVSQAAFSRRIQSLEHWVGTALIVKGASPVRLTEAGAQFREEAAASVERLLGARAKIRGKQFELMSQVRIAIPNVLARSDFKTVLRMLGGKVRSSFSVSVGNTHEVTARYLAGDADILLCHDSLALPSPVHSEAQERLVVRRDLFAPYAVLDPARRAAFGFPGTPQAPFLLVAYSHRAYFMRLFDHILERAEAEPSYKITVQCDMSDVLKEVIAEGHGVGWLPASAVDAAAAALIGPIGGREWALDVEICAYRPRRALAPEVEALWRALSAEATRNGGAP